MYYVLRLLVGDNYCSFIFVLHYSLFAEHDSGEVKLCNALTEFAWVTLEEAKKYDLISGICEEIEMVANCLKGNSVGEWRKQK